MNLYFNVFSLHFIFCACGRHLDDGRAAPTEGKIVLVQAGGGIIAGATASCVTTPLDTIKTRLQVSFLWYILLLGDGDLKKWFLKPRGFLNLDK